MLLHMSSYLSQMSRRGIMSVGQAPGFNAPIALRLAKTKPAMPTTYTKPSLEQNNKADRD